MRLYCFHHAGAGTTSFAPWPRLLGPSFEVVPVLLPGRDARIHEPRITELTDLHREVRNVFDSRPPVPYALYGHSLGALVAHHVADQWQRFAPTPPQLLVVGASPPPDMRVPVIDDALPSEHQLLRLLGHSGARALPVEVLQTRILPLLRDDLALARALRLAAERPADVPLLALSGTRDELAGPDTMAGWSRWTTAAFTQRTIPGDHYFVRETALPGLLMDALAAVTRAPESTTRAVRIAPGTA
ncbi:thioesterase domain-containing protein [Kitasatospora sp. NBC_01250]|uniref:thioesterase II family protein n=1 Tax=Kitasatospora sp. NBC_01250 TaxID=2903571 RepID=UPI002E2EAA4E|nr:thioesterase domain-containing protein [Kitasatospora sp. NBC_01250]